MWAKSIFCGNLFLFRARSLSEAKSFPEDSCRETGLGSCRRALDLWLLCQWHRYTEARCHRLRCRLLPEEVITLLSSTSFVGSVTEKNSIYHDQTAHYVLALLLDLDVPSILDPSTA